MQLQVDQPCHLRIPLHFHYQIQTRQYHKQLWSQPLKPGLILLVATKMGS